MGLSRDVQNLVILTYADQTNRTFFKGPSPFRPGLNSLDDDLELREQTLPSEGDWREAVRRAGILFGLTPAEVRNAGNVAKLVEQVVDKAKQLRPAVDAMSRELEQKLVSRGIDTTSADRLTTARTAQAMLNAVIGASSDGMVKAFVAAALRTSDTAMGRAMIKAPELDAALRDWPGRCSRRWANWQTTARRRLRRS